MTDAWMYGWDQQAYLEQIAAEKKAKAAAEREAFRVKIGIATVKPWGDKDVETVRRAIRRDSARI